VGGLVGAMLLSIFLLPTLYVWFAGDRDKLPEAEAGFEEGA
jgi:cobalt-zinc-cadmium resistance protein CzcA